MLLVGGAVAFAGGALDNGPRRPPAATAPPPPALTLLDSREPVTRRADADLVAVRPPGLRADQAYFVRVYVNGAQVRERPLPADERFTIEGIPLAQGENVVVATLVGDGGEGPPSGEMTIVRDDEPPVIRVSHPDGRSTVYGDSELMRGRTEAGATLTVTRSASRDEVETTVQEDGRFSALLELRVGANTFVLRSSDAAGNQSSTRVTIVRAESVARIALAIKPGAHLIEELPGQVAMIATVRDEVGRVVDDVEVTFGVSPPDRPTTTHRVTTTNGRARWDLQLLPSDSTGIWLVTVSATLPSGLELRQNGSFSLE